MQATKQIGKNGVLKICLMHCAQQPGASWDLRCCLLSLFVNHMHHWQYESMCALGGTHVYNQAELYLLKSIFIFAFGAAVTEFSHWKWRTNKKWKVVTISLFLCSFVLKKLIANTNCYMQNNCQPQYKYSRIYFQKLTFEKLKQNLFSEHNFAQL